MQPTRSAPADELSLDARLAAPDEETVAALESLEGDIVILGAGGKMGPTVARMAQRALQHSSQGSSRRVIAVSRFSNPDAPALLEASGVEVVRADLSDPAAVAKLPLAPNVLWMAGQKFGTTGDPVGTWTRRRTLRRRTHRLFFDGQCVRALADCTRRFTRARHADARRRIRRVMRWARACV